MTANQLRFHVISLSELDAKVGRPVVVDRKLARLRKLEPPHFVAGARQMKWTKSPQERTDLFWMKVDIKSPNECWPWFGRQELRGYGSVATYGRTRTTAHRIAYLTVNGEIDDALFACHKCDNPNCVNPRHIYAGTQAQNQKDCLMRGRSPVARLTVDKVEELRRLHASGGLSLRALGQMYGVKHSTILQAVHRRTWI